MVLPYDYGQSKIRIRNHLSKVTHDSSFPSFPFYLTWEESALSVSEMGQWVVIPRGSEMKSQNSLNKIFLKQ